MKVDLNSDLGESFGAYTIGMDKEVIPLVTSANIACGFHAGDPAVMQKTIALAHENRIGLGAHPGYPDLVGFGRRTMAVSPKDVYAMVVYQVVPWLLLPRRLVDGCSMSNPMEPCTIWRPRMLP